MDDGVLCYGALENVGLLLLLFIIIIYSSSGWVVKIVFNMGLILTATSMSHWW